MADSGDQQKDSASVKKHLSGKIYMYSYLTCYTRLPMKTYRSLIRQGAISEKGVLLTILLCKIFGVFCTDRMQEALARIPAPLRSLPSFLSLR